MGLFFNFLLLFEQQPFGADAWVAVNMTSSLITSSTRTGPAGAGLKIFRRNGSFGDHGALLKQRLWCLFGMTLANIQKVPYG
jgi:hypothetical protein